MRRLCTAAALAILLCGCGASGRPAGGGVAVAELTSKAPPGLARTVSGPSIGTTQAIETRGAHLAVTVRRVIDPLRGSGAQLPPRSRAVGVIVQIRSSGPSLYDSSATGDVRLVPARGSATPVLATRGVCRTPHQDFDRYITAGEDRVGCVVFALPRGVPVEGVRFDPHAQERGRVSWSVAPSGSG